VLKNLHCLCRDAQVFYGGRGVSYQDIDDNEVEYSSGLEDIESRVDELESRPYGVHSGYDGGLTLGYGMGMMIAIVCSWSRNGSILWAMLHGAFSWAYVAYFAFTRS
jgi:hypothetical protein